MSFFAELKRRNVFKVGVAYAIVAWLLIQIVATVFPILALPDWTTRFITIVTIIGFPLALILAWIYELTPEGIKVTTPEGPAQYHTQTTGQRLNYFIIGVLVLVVAFLLGKDFVLKESPEVGGKTPKTSVVTETASPAETVKEKSEPTAPPNSIAVLPFKNMSSDPEQEYFADGMAEEILNSLARIKDLEVRGRTSSFYFKGKTEDLPTISKMLNVKYILEGSVRKAYEQVRITVQLINTQTDEHLWSKTYDRNLRDIFAVQEDIAKSVADTLQISLGVGELGKAPGMTRNVQAYDAFLAGRFGSDLGRDALSRAIEQLEQAVALDPDFAIAWLALGNAYQNAMAFIPERASEFVAKSNAALSRVIELEPEADYALRIKAEQSGNLVEVERLLKKALALRPADSNSNGSYAAFLLRVGRPTEAIDYFRRALRIEPLSSLIHYQLGLSYQNSGNSTAAAEAYKQARDQSNQSAFSNAALLVLALEENNHKLIDKYTSLLLNTELLGNINRAETRDLNEVMDSLLDDPRAAIAELGNFMSDPAYDNPFNRGGIAIWANYFGEHDLALELTQKNSISDVTWRPINKDMRRLPGFKGLVINAKLVDYWRETGNWGEFCHPVGDDDFECN